jgi:ATP-dependent Clp protease ATP-binding subunit ClpX
VEIEARLLQRGYKGQVAARRALSLMAYRHVRRLRAIYLENVPREKLPPKTNSLLMGPTGCGKTYLVELLFRDILRLPTVIIDITGFSETGYVGRDAVTILTSLIHAAGGNPARASLGVVCLDEFDKLATGPNVARFSGEGTTKDVSGYGVQRELLKQLTAGVLDVPVDYSVSYASRYVRMRVDDITYIACGAFSGFKGIRSTGYDGSEIGFRGTPGEREDEVAYRLEEEEVNDTISFLQYGFIPELIARFGRIVALEPLSREVLKDILRDNVIPQFVREFRNEHLVLKVHESVLDHVVDRALERRTGARGLHAQLTRILEEAAFHSFGREVGEVRLRMRNGKPVVERIVTPREEELEPAPDKPPDEKTVPEPMPEPDSSHLQLLDDMLDWSRLAAPLEEIERMEPDIERMLDEEE